MMEKMQALLVQGSSGPPDALRLGLEEQSIEIVTAQNCFEAALVLSSKCPPHLVFTDVQFDDGNWTDVLHFAAGAATPVNVIVVSPKVDVGLYIRAMEHGAFDFIVSPPSAPEVSHVVRVAAANVCTRRSKPTAIARATPLAIVSQAQNL